MFIFHFNTKYSKNHTQSTEKLVHRVLALRTNTQKLSDLCEKNFLTIDLTRN